MTLSGAELLALQEGGARCGLFFRLAVDPVLRCWLGIGDIKPGINAVDPTDEVYFGFGQLLGLPAMAQLLNGAADRVEIGLSGVDERILELSGFANAVHGAACHIGLGLMNSDWSLLGPVHWVRRYEADLLRMTVTPAATPREQTTHSAILSIASQTTARRRPRRSYYTPQDQEARSIEMNPTLPTDRSCERVPSYSLTTTKTWPRFF